MRRIVSGLLLLWCGIAQAQTATREPAPRPPGWPSDICLAEGINAINPLCGTCSTSVWFPMANLGTSIQWTCKGADGKWMTHSIIRPWMTPPIRPSMADVLTKGPFGAWWDANAVRTSPADEVKYAALTEAAKPWIDTAVRPPEPAPVGWVVTPVSTGMRSSFVAPAGVAVREQQFVPTITAGKPTPCDCDGPGNSVMFASQKLCAVRGYKTAAGQQRFAACQAVK
jgi:hypothetical protein